MIHCLGLCLQRQQGSKSRVCRSFNFADRTCYMLNTFVCDGERELKDAPGFSYYDLSDDFSKEVSVSQLILKVKLSASTDSPMQCRLFYWDHLSLYHIDINNLFRQFLGQSCISVAFSEESALTPCVTICDGHAWPYVMVMCDHVWWSCVTMCEVTPCVITAENMCNFYLQLTKNVQTINFSYDNPHREKNQIETQPNRNILTWNPKW